VVVWGAKIYLTLFFLKGGCTERKRELLEKKKKKKKKYRARPS
jgi:hypothetical protein